MFMRFRDRREAGCLLAARLTEYSNRNDVIVLGLPRGGVPVAFEVARALHAPLDVFVVRKLGVPGHEELAFGAIATGGARVINETLASYLAISEETIEAIAAREWTELERRERLFRGTRPLPRVEGHTIILVDDGLATGATMRAAVQALLQSHPATIVVATPVGARDTCDSFDDPGTGVTCVCVIATEALDGVGLWYEDFSQTTDSEVCALLELAGIESGARGDAAPARAWLGRQWEGSS
jgi:putative phosphoribosyl transferase